jgi:hypothetical protein
MKELLLKAPDSQLDSSMLPLIKAWDEPPKAIQILEVVDKCIHGSLASSFVMVVLQGMYDQALKNEGLTHEQLVPLATWRGEE